MKPISHKLTKEQVKEIKKLYQEGWKKVALAKQYKVTAATIQYHVKKVLILDLVDILPTITGEFMTSDKTLAASLMTQNCNLQKIIWKNQWAEFVFQNTAKMEMIIQMYNEHNLLIEPRKFYQMIQRLSTEIYQHRIWNTANAKNVEQIKY